MSEEIYSPLIIAAVLLLSAAWSRASAVRKKNITKTSTLISFWYLFYIMHFILGIAYLYSVEVSFLSMMLFVVVFLGVSAFVYTKQVLPLKNSNS